MKKENTISSDSEKGKQLVEKHLSKDKLSWEKWKSECYEKGIPGISKENSDLVIQYLKDMETGLNVSSKNSKGPRSPRRLSDLKDKMVFFSKKFEHLNHITNMANLSETQIFNLFYNMQQGDIKTKSGVNYRSIDTFAKTFKAFWHWHIKVSRKEGTSVEDLTQDLDAKGEKPDWVYLTEVQIRKLAESMDFDYRVLIMFLLDTGIRSPLELLQIKVSDLYNECKELNIRICKKNSFPRKIKLMLCSELLKTYIKIKNKKPEDYLFPVCPDVINRNLKKAAVRLFGDNVSLAGHKYSQITMYDFRHNSCCYWLPRYKSESALKYRFGWKKSDKIHYYSELLGMKDTISEEDILTDVTKTEIENRLKSVEHENNLLKNRCSEFERYIKIIDELSRKVEIKITSST